MVVCKDLAHIVKGIFHTGIWRMAVAEMKQRGRCAVSAFAGCEVLLFGGELLESLLEGACRAFCAFFLTIEKK